MSKELKYVLDKVHDRQESMSQDITEIKTILARQEGVLETHVMRTDIAEANLALLRADVKPIQEWKDNWSGALRLVLIVGSVAAAVSSMLALLQ